MLFVLMHLKMDILRVRRDTATIDWGCNRGGDEQHNKLAYVTFCLLQCGKLEGCLLC